MTVAYKDLAAAIHIDPIPPAISTKNYSKTTSDQPDH